MSHTIRKDGSEDIGIESDAARVMESESRLVERPLGSRSGMRLGRVMGTAQDDPMSMPPWLWHAECRSSLLGAKDGEGRICPAAKHFYGSKANVSCDAGLFLRHPQPWLRYSAGSPSQQKGMQDTTPK